MDRQPQQSKDCIITLQEENSPCIGSNKPEIDQSFLCSQFSLIPNLQMMEQMKLMQTALYSQMIGLNDEPRQNLELLTHQLLQQQLMFNAAFLNQIQQGTLDVNQSQTKDCDNKIKRKHIKKNHNPQYNTGHWTAQEHQMYLNFLQQHKEVMESPELKKTNKIFKLMSDIIKSRSPSQCRSHHQKFNPYSKYIQSNSIVRRKMREDGILSKDSQSNYQQSQPQKFEFNIKQEMLNYNKMHPQEEEDVEVIQSEKELQQPVKVETMKEEIVEQHPNTSN